LRCVRITRMVIQIDVGIKWNNTAASPAGPEPGSAGGACRGSAGNVRGLLPAKAAEKAAGGGAEKRCLLQLTAA